MTKLDNFFGVNNPMLKRYFEIKKITRIIFHTYRALYFVLLQIVLFTGNQRG